jgi:hypothetical protein
VSFGDILSFLVRRQNVAKNKVAFEGQKGEFLEAVFLLCDVRASTGMPTRHDDASFTISLPDSINTIIVMP